MTSPINNNEDWSKQVYVQLDGGIYKTNKDQATKGNASAKIGVKYNINNGPYFEGNIGMGTGFQTSGKVGYEINVNDKTDIEIYTNAKYLKQINNKSSEEDNPNGYKKAGGGFSVNFKEHNKNIKMGLEAGYRNSLGKSNSQDIFNQGRKSKFYITPTLNAEWYLDKDKMFSIIAEADRYEMNAGLKLTF